MRAFQNERQRISSFAHGHLYPRVNNVARKNKMDLKIRIARATDLSDIADLCRRAVGPYDYVIPRLEAIIWKKQLFIVFSGSKLVAMSNFTRAIDGSGWLSMARTDPQFRGRGIAQFMQRSVATRARRMGIQKLRFWILSTNSSSLRAAEKGGFAQVSEATHLSRNLGDLTKNLRSKGSVSHTYSDSFLSDSRYLKMMKGFCGYKNTFVKMNLKTLAAVPKHEIHNMTRSAFILAGPDSVEQSGEFSLLQGEMGQALNDLITEASRSSLKSLGGFVPTSYSLVRVARRFGFRVDPWARRALIFEKKI
jgi:GNAT superfamily N-acetyltransferase